MERGGWDVLQRYNSSLEEALERIYPDYEWNQDLFVPTERHPIGYWSKVENQRNFFDKIGKELGITKVTIPF